MSTLRTLTIDQALADRSSELWVINNYADRDNKTADILGECRDPNNVGAQVKTFKIPASWIPQRISDISTKEAFLEGSDDFRYALQRKWLVIVSPSESKNFLKDNGDAQKEADRLSLIIQGNQIGVNTLIRDDKDEEFIDLNRVRTKSKPTEERISNLMSDQGSELPGSRQNPVTPQVIHIMGQSDDEMSPVSKLNALKGIPSLSNADFEYIHRNTDKDKHEDIIKWIESRKDSA